MKMKNLFYLVILLSLFQIGYAQSSTTFVSLLPTETKTHTVKVVLRNNIKDTILSNIIVKYNAKEPFQLIVNESFVGGKIQFRENNKTIFRQEKDIHYLMFTDHENQKRHFAFIPDLKEKNVAEIKAQGKVNYYRVYSNKDIVSASHGRAFIEKDGKWVKHKKWIDKNYFTKIQSLINDEPDLANKLNTEEISQKEIFQILNEYNKRKL